MSEKEKEQGFLDNDQLYREIISEGSRAAGFGSTESITQNAMYGLNHRQIGPAGLPIVRDGVGYTFFTKPIMNLAKDNVSASRTLAYLGSSDPDSIGCAIKCMLSPLPDAKGGARGIPYDNRKSNVRSNIVDDRQAFIPLLSRCLVSLTGFPDKTLDTYTTDEGLAKSSIAMADDIPDIYGTFNLTATFSNVEGDILTSLFNAWYEYMGRVSHGALLPYTEMMMDFEKDYECRVYRIITSADGEYLTKIAAPAAMFPTAVDIGGVFNVSLEKAYIDSNEEISIPFMAQQMHYNDPILIREFNTIVSVFNSSMHDDLREKEMVRVQGIEKDICNYYLYMHINEDTKRITWWTPKEVYNILLGKEAKEEKEKNK